MSDETPKPSRSSRPTSLPPEPPADLESSWDDDTVPRFELDDPMSESAFDRVTAIPEVPAEAFAKQVMSELQPHNAPTAVPPPLRDSPDSPAIASEPPAVSVEALDPMDLEEEPRQARVASSPGFTADWPTDASGTSSSTSVTARPGRPAPAPESDFDLDMERTPVTPFPVPSASLARDPRDPELELDLSVPSGSAPPATVRAAQGGALGEMKDRYAMGDFTGALAVAEDLLEKNADDADALRYAQSCRDVLTQMYTARLGALSQRVRVAVPSDQIRWLSLDHRSGFVLSLIDGSSTVEELLDISGMNRLDALRILYTLYDQRVIALG